MILLTNVPELERSSCDVHRIVSIPARLLQVNSCKTSVFC